jgi:hypothetical protein
MCARFSFACVFEMWSFVERRPICQPSSSDPQEIFEADQSVLYISLHRYGEGFYPGSGVLLRLVAPRERDTQ